MGLYIKELRCIFKLTVTITFSKVRNSNAVRLSLVSSFKLLRIDSNTDTNRYNHSSKYEDSLRVPR